jgi:hypothetical protein
MIEEPKERTEPISVEELEAMVEEAFDLKRQHAEAKKTASAIHHDLTMLQAKIGVELDKLKKDSYHAKKGIFSKREEPYYRLPQDDDNRKKFFDYLKERGVYDTMITVNARSLQSFVKQEVEIKEDEGDFDFVPSGIELGEYRTVYSMRKS